MRFREWNTQQTGSRSVGPRPGDQSVPAAAEQVPHGLAHGADLRGKLHRDQGGQEIGLRLGRCSPDTGIAPHLHFIGDQTERTANTEGSNDKGGGSTPDPISA